MPPVPRGYATSAPMLRSGRTRRRKSAGKTRRKGKILSTPTKVLPIVLFGGVMVPIVDFQSRHIACRARWLDCECLRVAIGREDRRIWLIVRSEDRD